MRLRLIMKMRLEMAREELEAWATEEAHRGISNMLDVEIEQGK